jgi:predicted nucleotidyltransferase
MFILRSWAVDLSKAAADRIMLDLQSYARQNGGRFIAYGSVARRSMRHDSDIDILVDFSTETTHSDCSFAEDLCFAAHLPPDIFPMSWHRPAFLDRVMKDALILS